MLGHYKDVEGKKIEDPEVKDATMRVLVGPDQGWEDHIMRVFELGPGGNTPKHTHDWPHINYIIEGSGILYLNGVENEISAGSYAYVPNGELHQFKNNTDKLLKFICIITYTK